MYVKLMFVNLYSLVHFRDVYFKLKPLYGIFNRRYKVYTKKTHDSYKH